MMHADKLLMITVRKDEARQVDIKREPGPNGEPNHRLTRANMGWIAWGISIAYIVFDKLL